MKNFKGIEVRISDLGLNPEEEKIIGAKIDRAAYEAIAGIDFQYDGLIAIGKLGAHTRGLQIVDDFNSLAELLKNK